MCEAFHASVQSTAAHWARSSAPRGPTPRGRCDRGRLAEPRCPRRCGGHTRATLRQEVSMHSWLSVGLSAARNPRGTTYEADKAGSAGKSGRCVRTRKMACFHAVHRRHSFCPATEPVSHRQKQCRVSATGPRLPFQDNTQRPEANHPAGPNCAGSRGPRGAGAAWAPSAGCHGARICFGHT